jgi:predicted 3-demethylubiquinone-9 3-methyltransferase (glyoxalase superfamily)
MPPMSKTAMQKITPFLWFDGNAEEAAKFYTSVFKNSRIVETARYGEAASQASGRPKGSAMIVTFELEGQRFIALNGGPVFKFNPAISLFVSCETQREVDELWSKLTEGGQEVQCGWLTDKFGVSWQIVPRILEEMIHSKDARRAENAMKAMLQMKKFDIAALKKAYEE